MASQGLEVPLIEIAIARAKEFATKQAIKHIENVKVTGDTHIPMVCYFSLFLLKIILMVFFLYLFFLKK